MPITTVYATRGGQDVTTITAALAIMSARAGNRTLLVDTGGDLPAILGLPDTDRPGLAEYLNPASRLAIEHVIAPVSDNLELIHRGTGPVTFDTSTYGLLTGALGHYDTSSSAPPNPAARGPATPTTVYSSPGPVLSPCAAQPLPPGHRHRAHQRTRTSTRHQRHRSRPRHTGHRHRPVRDNHRPSSRRWTPHHPTPPRTHPCPPPTPHQSSARMNPVGHHVDGGRQTHHR